MKYSEGTYLKALSALAALRETLTEKEQHTVDFVAEAIAEKADRDTAPATHADHIRSMDDEELAKHLFDFQINSIAGWLERAGQGGKTVPGMLAWLRQPAEEVDDGQTI